MKPANKSLKRDAAKEHRALCRDVGWLKGGQAVLDYRISEAFFGRGR